MNKNEILQEFSSDPDRYYRVRLFEEQGFVRKSCSKCSRYFWTLDAEREFCPDDAPDTYSFIGQPPTSKRLDYTQSWRQVEEFFIKNGHSSIPRYPVVCRWRDDLYFTIASIVDFQRVMGSKVIFEFPTNPLVVPQTCLRFKDLENVGVTGRHFSSFCMIGQHSIPESGGYWKDECMDLDFRLLTEQFGIRKEEIVFVEDVWAGGGSFGSSLEYFVRGLELGNAVFTEFQGELGKHTTLDQKIIDMGAGLERFAWITMGTPTAYDCCFGPVSRLLSERIGAEYDSDILPRYFTEVAKALDSLGDLNSVRRHAARQAGLTDGQMDRVISPLEGTYLIADHLRTLIFAIADGALPSNVGGGYNLRMMLRRINDTAKRIGLKMDIDELVDAHVDYLRDTYTELDSRRRDIKEILQIELQRYEESKIQMKKKAERIMERDVPTVDELITLYESDGITPDYLKEIGAIKEIPSTFYSRLSDLHQSEKKKPAANPPPEGLPQTDALFYWDDPMEFDAKVLKSFGDCIVLDKTSFYARGGGQEPDHGIISGFKVIDVEKHGGVIVHKLHGGTPEEGQTVQCMIDARRRSMITKNHTSTHIINASSRKILGSWVWQHSAFKDEDHARLDITHHSSLTEQQVRKIEDAANQMVSENIPVDIQQYDRNTAEQKYGFRIYQGGVVPVKSVRIVSIGDMDVEACGGTHVNKTGDIEFIKITKTKRIQDGVVRIEFVSGTAAFEYVTQQKQNAQRQKEADADREKIIKLRKEKRQKARDLIPAILDMVMSNESGRKEEIQIQDRQCFTASNQYNELFHTKLGRKMVKMAADSTYCGIFEAGPTVRVIVCCGLKSGKNAGEIARKASAILDGHSGGDAVFAQGGGKDMSKKDKAIAMARSMILG